MMTRSNASADDLALEVVKGPYQVTFERDPAAVGGNVRSEFGMFR